MPQYPHEQRPVGHQAVHPGAGEGARQDGARLLAGGAERDDLGEHRVVVHADVRAVLPGLHAAVHPQARPERSLEAGVHPGHLERPQRAGGRLPVVGGVLRVEAGLDRPAADRGGLGRGQGAPGGHVELQPDEVQTRRRLGHRMLDLQPRVHLEEEELPGVDREELDRPGAGVADRCGGVARGGEELLPHAGGALHQRAGRLLEHLLVAALDRALALAHRPHRAVGVGHHLHLDVPTALEVALAEHRIGAERRGRLALRGGDLVGQRIEVAHHAHSASAAAGGGLDQHGELGGRDRLGIEIGEHRHARSGHPLLGLDLGTHGVDGLGRRPDPGEAGVDHGAGEVRVLGQEAVAGVHGVGARLAGGLHYEVRAQVRVRRGVAGRADGRIGLEDVRRIGVRVGVQRDGRQAATARGDVDAPGDFAAVGDEHRVDGAGRRQRGVGHLVDSAVRRGERRRAGRGMRIGHDAPHIRKTPKRSVPATSPEWIADSASPSTVRVSRGSITPSS